MPTELLSALGGCQVLKGTSSILVTTKYWSPGGPSYGYRLSCCDFQVFGHWWYDSRLEFSYETPGGKLQHPKQLSGTTSGKGLMNVPRHHQSWSSKFCKPIFCCTVLHQLFITRMLWLQGFFKALCEKMVKHTSNQPSPVSASNLQISSAAFVLARGTSPVIQSAMSSFAPPFLKAWKQLKEAHDKPQFNMPRTQIRMHSEETHLIAFLLFATSFQPIKRNCNERQETGSWGRTCVSQPASSNDSLAAGLDPHGRKYHSVQSWKFMCCIFNVVYLEKACEAFALECLETLTEDQSAYKEMRRLDCS